MLTPTATEEPTATATEAPTSTPEPTATEEPAEANVELGQWLIGEPSSTGSFSIVGEVLNTGENMAEEIQVVITLLDANGTILGSTQAHDLLPVIVAGGKCPFSTCVLDVDRAAVADIQFQVQFDSYDPDGFLADFYVWEFESPQVQWTDQQITGQVTNISDRPASLVEVMVIGYNDAMELVGVESTFTDLDVLDPETTSPFTVRLLDPYSTIPTTVEVYASGFAEDE